MHKGSSRAAFHLAIHYSSHETLDTALLYFFKALALGSYEALWRLKEFYKGTGGNYFEHYDAKRYRNVALAAQLL